MEDFEEERTAMKIFAIVGPTSTGKTSLALELCKRFDGEIISADSRQVYKHMDVGTGKLPLGSSTKIQKGDGFWDFGGTILLHPTNIFLPMITPSMRWGSQPTS